MNETKRRAIIWDTIERIAFRPNSNNDRSTWLAVYARTLHKLWGTDSIRNHFGSNDIFNIPFLNLKCDYTIDNAKKYSVSLQDSSTCRSYWQNDIDPDYLSKASLHFSSDQYPSQQRAHLQRDIEVVLDGMLFHPRCHTHLEDIGVRHVQLDQGRDGLSSHEVRVSGGIENPYVFLFHLRYQFCLVADLVRRIERQRLINLFDAAIRDNNSAVSASDLHNFQRGNN